MFRVCDGKLLGGRHEQMVRLCGLRTGRMACCIFNLRSHDYRANSGIFWKPFADRHNSNDQFSILFWGRSLKRLEGAGIELSSVQLVHKFAATLSNTMIHKQFKNDKRGFGKFGPLAEGRRVSRL